MKKSVTINELEARKRELLQSLRLTNLLSAGVAPTLLGPVDQQYIADLLERVDMPWGYEGACPELTQLFRDGIQASEDGARMALETDVDFLEQVSASGDDVIHRGLFGTVEAAFPVRLRGKVIHCIWSGKIKDKPFSESDMKDIARFTGQTKEDIEKLTADIPIFTPEQADQILDICRRLRDALKQAISQHAQVRELTNQLLASERTHSLGTLSGGVAHHFNNLLSVILGYASHIHNREGLSDDADNALLKITEAAQRGRRLTEEILAFAGGDSEDEAPCKVHDTIESVLSLLQSQTSSRVKVATDFQATCDTVIAPPGSIRQIIFNLLMNAMDSMTAGGELSVHSSNQSLPDEAGQQSYLRIEVTDSSGRVPEGAEAAYDPNASAGDTLAGERTGLKFNSLYGMIGRLDGTMTTSSEPGEHTRVEVLLPVDRDETELGTEQKVRQKLAASEIWVVDDDPIFREMCNQVLTDDGHAISEIAGGSQLQELWESREKRPDLLIVDFSMPEYNGLELCEWLREKGSKVPVVLVSGFSPNQRDIRKALQLHRTYFLQKPFTFREMTDTVTVALGETLIGE